MGELSRFDPREVKRGWPFGGESVYQQHTSPRPCMGNVSMVTVSCPASGPRLHGAGTTAMTHERVESQPNSALHTHTPTHNTHLHTHAPRPAGARVSELDLIHRKGRPCQHASSRSKKWLGFFCPAFKQQQGRCVCVYVHACTGARLLFISMCEAH